jgi:hypothetical protein
MIDKYKKQNYNKLTTNSWFLPALALLFIALKLTGHITWSWWWVLSPLWIPFLIAFTVALVVAFVAAFKK